MNYRDGDEVVPELRLRLGEDGPGEKGGYVDLGECEADGSPPSPWRGWRGLVLYWVKLALLFSCLGLLAGVCLKWVWPFFMDKVGALRLKLFP